MKVSLRELCKLRRHGLIIALLLSLFLHFLILSVNIETKKYYSSPRDTTFQVKLTEGEASHKDPPLDTQQTPDTEFAPSPAVLENPAAHAQTTSPSSPIDFIGESADTRITQPDPQAHAVESPPRLTREQLSRLVNDGPVEHLTMQFELYEGIDRISLGKGLHHYESDDAGNYSIGVVSDKVYDASRDSEPAWEIEIKGSITPRGLRPMRYMRKGEQAQTLMTVSRGEIDANAADNVSGLMPDGILDRVSLLYQFMNVAISGTEGTIQLTDGEEIATYTYGIIGTEPINVPQLGAIESQRITFSNTDNGETIDLWLASDLRNIPMKVVHRNASGLVTEQVLSSITIR